MVVSCLLNHHEKLSLHLKSSTIRFWNFNHHFRTSFELRANLRKQIFLRCNRSGNISVQTWTWAIWQRIAMVQNSKIASLPLPHTSRNKIEMTLISLLDHRKVFAEQFWPKLKIQVIFRVVWKLNEPKVTGGLARWGRGMLIRRCTIATWDLLKWDLVIRSF